MPKEKDVLKKISKQLTGILSKITNQGQRLDSIEKNQSAFDKDLNAGFAIMSKQMSDHTKRINDRVEKGIETVQVLYENMQTKFETVSEGNIDHDRRLNEHEKRINKLEKQI